MSTKALGGRLLDYLAGGLPAARKSFDAATGRFLHESGGWAVTKQDVVYPMALLYTTPGRPQHGDGDILRMILGGGDAWRDAQDEEGRFEFVKVDGSRWGKTYMPWSMYHWLETYVLMRGQMDKERRSRWEDGLRLAFAGAARELADHTFVHNIPTWHGMALVRASEVFGEASWKEVGARLIAQAAAAQDPDGYWPEGGGPTTSYNLVYVHALGLYYRFTQDESVLVCLKRALEFHMHFTYPDGSGVAAVDGRVRYGPGISATGLPGFVPFPRGRRFVRFLVDRLCERNPQGGLTPHLASAAMCLTDGAEAAIPQEQGDYASVHNGHGLVRRRGPWSVCLSGYLTPTEELPLSSRVRWHKDRQNYVGIWHRDVGLVVGGGSSKKQPEFSTFEVIAGRTMRWEADEAELVCEHDGDVLRLKYGETTCRVRVRVVDESRIEIGFGAEGPKRVPVAVVGGLCLPCVGGRELVAAGSGGPCALDPERTWRASWAEDDASEDRWLRIGRVRLDLPPGAGFDWPIYPVNPYAINNAAPPAQAVGVVAVPVAVGAPEKVVAITVEDEPEA